VSRPPQAGQPTLSVDLDFGRSSVDGYIANTGPVLQVDILLQQLESAESDPGVQHFLSRKKKGPYNQPSI